MANKELMVTLGLDATSYAQNIKRAKDLNKELDSSWNLLASSSDKFEDSLQGLGKKHEYLSKKIEVANNLTDVFAKRIAESELALKKSREEQEQYSEKLEKFNSLKQRAIDNGKEESSLYTAISEKIKAYTQLKDKASKAIEINTKKVLEAQSGYSQTQESLQKLGKESTLTAEKMSAMRADANIEALSKDVSDLDHKFSLAKSSVSNFDSTMEGLQQTQDYLNDKTKITQKILEGYSGEIENSTKKIDYYENELRDVSKELEDWNELLQELDRNEPDYDLFRKEVEGLRFEYTNLNQTVEFHKDRIENLQGSYKTTEKDLAKMEGSLDSTSKKMQSMNDKITFEPITRQVKDLTNNAIKNLESEISKLDKDFEIITTSCEGFESSITGLEQKQVYYNKTLGKTKSVFNQYNKDLTDTKSKVMSLTEEQIRLEKEIQDQIDLVKNNKMGAEWDKQAKSVEELKKDYERVNKELELHNNHLKNVEKNYDSSRLSVSQLTKELDKTDKQLEQIEKQKAFDNLDKNIKTVTDKIKLLDSEFKIVESTARNFGNTKKELGVKSDYYKEKIGLLKQQMETLQTSIVATENELETLKRKQDRATESAENLRIKLKLLDKDSPEFEKTLIAIINLESEIEDLNSDIDKNVEKHNKLQNELNQTVADTNNLARETDSLGAVFVSGKLSKAGEKINSLGQGIENLGRSLMPITMAMGALGVGIVKTGVDFETSMSKVKAVMQSTQEEFELLELRAREMGSTTIFTAQESAEALSYLGLAGYNATQAMEALPQILQLAQAGALDLATASDKATDAVASLGFVGDDAVAKLPEFLNKVAQSAVNSNTSIEQMLDAYIKVGGQLDNLNIGLDTSSAMLGVLANRGLKAEEAGTALNSILINLTKEGGQSAEAMEQLGVSMFDAEGKVRNIEDVMLDLHASLSRMTKEDQVKLINMIGGKTQAKTIQKLFQGMIDDTGNLSKEYKELKAEIEKAPDMNALENMSDIMTDNLGGDLKILMSQIQETFMVLFDEFEPQLREFVQNLTEGLKELTSKFKEMSPEQKEMIFDFAKWVAIAPVAITLIGKVTSLFGGATKGIGKLVEGWDKLRTVLNGGKAIADTATALSTGATALSGVTTAGGFASKALGVLSGAFGGVSLATLGWVAGGATLAVGAGVALKNTLEQEVVPSVDLFADSMIYSSEITTDAMGDMQYAITSETVKISEATQQAVQAYLTMDEGVRTALTNLYINSTPITSAIATEMTGKFDEMGNVIKTGMQEDCDAELTILSDFFGDSAMLNDSYLARLTEKQQKFYDDKKVQIDEAETEINKTLERAMNEGRELKESEVEYITMLQNHMRDSAVKTLSEQELEANVILERMKSYDNRMTAEMVSENIKELNKGRDEAVKVAEEEFEERLKVLISMRDESGVISESQADTLIKEAERQRDKTIESAEDTRKKTLEKLEDLGEDSYKQVNEDTGEIMTLWDKLQNKWDSWFPKEKTVTINETKKKKTVYLPSEGSTQSLEPQNFIQTLNSSMPVFDMTIPIPRDNPLNGYQTSGGYYSPKSVQKPAPKKSSNSKLVEALVEQNKLLMQLLGENRHIEVGVNVDGRQVAKASAKYMDAEISLINKRKNRLGGTI